MMEVSIRSFQLTDLSALLRVWNAALPYDAMGRQRFESLMLLDENFDADLCKVAYVNEQLVGFAYGIRRKFPYLERGLEKERGWIGIMGVLPDYQHNGIGTKLLQCVEDALIRRGTKEITLCAYSPNYITPGIDLRYTGALSLVNQHAYQENGDAVSMQMDLFDHCMEGSITRKKQELQEQGILIRAYRQEDMLELLDFLLEQFGAGWKRNAWIAMQEGIADQTILIVEQHQSIVGFCMRRIDGNDGRFGPFGVHEALRSHGIGGVLFEEMMQNMRRAGVTNTYLMWTNGAAKRFYERHGMKVFREYKLYRKRVG